MLIAFFAGAAVMIVEIAANRFLAPMFGNSLYTWTGVIGVILIALSAGYYIGGWLVDRRPDYTTLLIILVKAAFFVLLIPILHRVLAGRFETSNIVWGPTIASLIFFAIPGCLLGSTSPFVMRLLSLTRADRNIGLSVGSIAMLSTVGSVIGTFATGFWLIPNMDLRTVIISVSITIFVLAAVGYFALVPGRRRTYVIPLILLIGFAAVLYLSILLSAEKSPGTVFEKTTFYHRIRVVEARLPGGEPIHALYLDTTLEGAQPKHESRVILEYQQYWQLARVVCPDIRRAAFLGGGAFAMPEALLEAYPGAVVDAVEIDPELIEIGKRFYRLDRYPSLQYHASDARRFLAVSPGAYDLIFGDVYSGLRYVPHHLVTHEFFGLVKRRLSSDGIFMMNAISAVTGEDADLFRSICETLRQVFSHIYVFGTRHEQPGDAQQVILMASQRDLSGILRTKAEEEPGSAIAGLLATFIPPDNYSCEGAPIFTDYYNPVEYIVAGSISRHAVK
jgi:spermidine synthase